jgi:hypothetical protein
MWREDACECGTDAAHALELLHGAEWTERIAVGDDACGERWTDARESFDFAGGRNVDIHLQTRGSRVARFARASRELDELGRIWIRWWSLGGGGARWNVDGCGRVGTLRPAAPSFARRFLLAAARRVDILDLAIEIGRFLGGWCSVSGERGVGADRAAQYKERGQEKERAAFSGCWHRGRTIGRVGAAIIIETFWPARIRAPSWAGGLLRR